MSKPFTGRHMAAVMVGAFGVIIAVNLTAATLAFSTFGGIVVENSYVASQKYNGWLQQAKEQRELGWRLSATRGPGGRIVLTTAGVPTGAAVTAVARHPVGRLPDTALSFTSPQADRYVSREALPPGRWIVRFTVEADGQEYRMETDLP